MTRARCAVTRLHLVIDRGEKRAILFFRVVHLFRRGLLEPLDADGAGRWADAPRLFKPFALDELYGVVGRVVDRDAPRQA